MFVDACAIIAVLSDEPEAERVSRALAGASKRITSPVAVLETVIALARPDKFNLSIEAVEPLVLEFLEARGIEIRDLPPAKRATAFSLAAAHRYRSGRHGLNLGDCLHYACAKYYRVPILATADEFRQTDLETVP
ncbi:type II toxin-antitoxin system VapC family toxin [Agrobacterium tumefaciens]|uniref:type II toxin-antitoxin system VapC family toxin n=1 Tax=Agrobacterium tumefaciens TaxID=358 RepID=UPI000DDE252C|nr:type II toxin-antitoxin system VapC family toxin [Agrobacterium tumefaciens]NSY99619.1 type II toxin-antitoxin system VapC family toxin [Agrobacterium tumefaciens]NSZ36372.1 type II toxin-antitoxin system VapC family toxin [Agrobacterium tumefaciens]NTB21888.1 type II toxin-antitoxin system VapC family toxin [Agrobacterium tumefaciens]NTB31766.1 type II toxin-antitoxin system VapC family toxin [Agrobacterium tumefaciens]NTB32247.1 type II toxin-antitoxin system VapC family toxin [Agrobacter